MSPPSGLRPRFKLDFPFVAPDRRYTAEVVAWRSPGPNGAGDVAGLRLHRDPPDGAAPCSLATADDLYGHRFQVFGFTPAHDTGVWVNGEIRGPDVVGNLQLSGDAAGGPRLTPGFSGAPVWDEVLQAVVGIASRATIGRTPSGGYCLPTKLVVEVWPEIEARTRPPCPYRGLLPMREVDAAYFFGREQVSRRLIKELPRGRLSLLMGPSGCGKSSVVRAGVLPDLRRRGDLLIAACRPGVAPFDALLTALAGVSSAGDAGTDDNTDSGGTRVSAALAAASSGVNLSAVVERLLDEMGYERLFLVVDQFEEVLAHPDEVVGDFARVLGELAAASRPDGRPLACVVVVARSDFAEQLTDVAALADALALGRDDPGEGIHHILPMTTEELRQMVERPAERLRVVRYDDGLVDRLMRDVRRLDNPLAPLAFTLFLLWERQRGGRIPLSAYEDIGEVAGALRIHLDRVYDEELDADDRETARLLLLRLTAPDGRGGQVRRPVLREQLDDQYWNVAQRLAGRRMLTLLTGSGQTELVELSHDALLDEWPRLRRWLAEETNFLEWHSTLRVAIESWEAADRSGRKLLEKAELTASLPALQKWGDRLMSHERDFIKRSEVFQRRTRRKRIARSAMVLLLVVAVADATIAAWLIYGRARTAKDIRASQDLVRQSGGSTDLNSLAFTLAAYRKYPTPEALSALNVWYQRTTLVDKLRVGDVSIAAEVELSPDGRFAIGSWGPASRRVLWDLERSAAPNIPVGPTSAGRQDTGTAFTPDSSHIVYADRKDIVFWDVRRRVPDRRVPIRAGGNGPVYLVAVAPHRDALAYVKDDSAYIADAHTGRVLIGPILARARKQSRIMPELRFDQSGRFLFLREAQDEWTIDLRTGQRVHGAVNTTPTDIDRPKCVTTSKGTTSVLGLVDIVIGGKRLLKGRDGECANYSMQIDRRNDELILISDTAAINPGPGQGSLLQIYSLRDGKLRGQFPIPEGILERVVPSERGGRIVLLSSSNYYLLLRVPPPGSFSRALSVAQSAALTRNGRHVVTLDVDGTLSLWDARTRQRLQAVHERWLRASGDRSTQAQADLIASPDSGKVAAFRGRRVLTVDIAAPYAVTTWPIDGQDGWVRDISGYPLLSASFTSADELLIQAGQVFTRWDTTSGRRLSAPMRNVPVTFDDDWAARPGHLQFAIAHGSEGIITLWDWERRAEVARWHTKTRASNIVFNRNGGLVAVAVTGSIVVYDVSDGHEVAHLPRFGKSADVDGKTIWDSDNARPISFVGERQLIFLSGYGTYMWTWPRWRVPLIAKDEIAQLPVEVVFGGSYSRVNALVQLQDTDDHGWVLVSTNPEVWRASLCALLTEGRVNTAEATAAAGRSLCGN